MGDWGRMNWIFTVLVSGSDTNSRVEMSRPAEGAIVSSSTRSSIASICFAWTRASGWFSSSSSCTRSTTSPIASSGIAPMRALILGSIRGSSLMRLIITPRFERTEIDP